MNAEQSSQYRYWAFISYSHQDNRKDGNVWGDWLHDAVESFKVPLELVGRPGRYGESVPQRLFPAFLDEKELPTNADLGIAISEALRQSRYLVVICSPGKRIVTASEDKTARVWDAQSGKPVTDPLKHARAV